MGVTIVEKHLLFDKIFLARGREALRAAYGAKKAMIDLTSQKGDSHLLDCSGHSWPFLRHMLPSELLGLAQEKSYQIATGFQPQLLPLPVLFRLIMPTTQQISIFGMGKRAKK